MTSSNSNYHRRIYPLVAFAVSSIFLLGVINRIHLISGELQHELFTFKNNHDFDFPDFDKITQFHTLTDDELSLNDPSRRVIIIGDLHGMNKSLHNLLHTNSYSPLTDTIIFAGDTMAKSTLPGSLAILEFTTQHRCGSAPGPVYAVRGNHDQMVVQWRAWRDWFEALELSTPSSHHMWYKGKPDTGTHPGPPVGTGREFLQLIESEWERDVEADPKGASDPDEWADTARKRAAGTWRDEWWRRIPRPGKGHQKKDWPIFNDHYWLAKEMTDEQKECLYTWPLVLHVISEHFFVVHAGLLPSDPRRPMTDKHQPLAHRPTLSASSIDASDGRYAAPTVIPEIQGALTSVVKHTIPKNETLTLLRTAQERALLTDIPANRDPWVLLNMRGVRKSGKVTRNNEKGTPWSDMWNDQISRCKGFYGRRLTNLEERHCQEFPGSEGKTGRKALPCKPATVVYGHAATRLLDIKRWSMGIDTGCVYGRRLTSLVLQRTNTSAAAVDDEADEYESEDVEPEREDPWSPALEVRRWPVLVDEPEMPEKMRRPRTTRIKFGDDGAGIDAWLVSVRCPDMGDLD